MTIDNNLEGLFKAIDPLNPELENRNATHADAIWSNVLASTQPTRHKRRRLTYIGAGSLATLATVTAVLLGTLPGTAPLSAAAATLTAAAHADASAAALPALASGQYYYQKEQVSMVCQVGTPAMGLNGTSLTYVADGTVQSWTSNDGSGKAVITPTAIDTGGSHFISAAEEARWVSLGKPFIPCALEDANNQLPGNAANANTGSAYGGYATSISGYGGFGFTLGWNSQTTLLSSSTNVNDLPTNVTQISSLLANGELNTDGSVSSTPQVCPADASSSAVGCDTAQQLTVIQQLLQVPDASAKLGAVLYQVLAQMPGAEISPSYGDTSQTVTYVSVPEGQGEKFYVAFDKNTGALIGSFVKTTSLGDNTPAASINYNTISVVNGIGTLPAPSNS